MRQITYTALALFATVLIVVGVGISTVGYALDWMHRDGMYYKLTGISIDALGIGLAGATLVYVRATRDIR